MNDKYYKFIFDEINADQLIKISQLRSIREIKQYYENNINENSNMEVRRMLSCLYSFERKGKKRFEFDFEKAVKFYTDGLLRIVKKDILKILDNWLESRRLLIVYHPLKYIMRHLLSQEMSVGEIPYEDLLFYIKLRKRWFTCQIIKEKANLDIPRGQIISLKDDDFYYEPPIKRAYLFYLQNKQNTKNAYFMQLASLMEVLQEEMSFSWDIDHYYVECIENIRDVNYKNNHIAIKENCSKYSLYFGKSFLDMQRENKYEAIKELLEHFLRNDKDTSDFCIETKEGVEEKDLNTLKGVNLLLVDYHRLTLAPSIVKDIIKDHGGEADLIEPEDVNKELEKNKYNVIGISLSDRNIEECLKFVEELRKKHDKLPIIIAGSSTLQYRELFALFDWNDIFFYIGDAENSLSGTIKHIVGSYKKKAADIKNLAIGKGLIFRTKEYIGVISPDKPNVVESIQIFLPHKDKNKVDYDWNPNRGCPNRCAYCNNVQGNWRVSSIIDMKVHMLAIVGHRVGFSGERIKQISNVLKENIKSLDGQHDLNKINYPTLLVEKVRKLFINSGDSCIKENSRYIDQMVSGRKVISKIMLYKILLMLNGLEALNDQKREQILGSSKTRLNIFTASDNFLVEKKKVKEFFHWLQRLQISNYFCLRTQSSINFLWDHAKKAPDVDLIKNMINAGIESIGLGYDSSSNMIGKDVLKGNTYNMMIKVFDALILCGMKKENIRIHHFYTTPISSFEETLEGLLLSAANIANDRGNKIAQVLYTYGSELGMLSKMGLSGSAWEWIAGVKSLEAPLEEYRFIHSEASFLPMIDKKAELFVRGLFQFNPKTQEYVESYNRNWIFAQCFEKELKDIIMSWISDEQEDPEIAALGRIIVLLIKEFPQVKLSDIFLSIKRLCINMNIFSYERLWSTLKQEGVLKKISVPQEACTN